MLSAFSDLREVLQNQRCPGAIPCDQDFGNHMVTVFAETVFAGANFLEASLSRPRAFRLKGLSGFKVTFLDSSPVPLPEKFISRSYNWFVDPKVASYSLGARYGGKFFIEDDMQVELVVFVEHEVTGTDFPVQPGLVIVTDIEPYLNSSSYRGQRNFLPIKPDTDGVAVVPNTDKTFGFRARDLLSLSELRPGRSGSIGGLYPRRARKLGTKAGCLSFWKVSQLVKLHTIKPRHLPPNKAHSIKRSCVAIKGIFQNTELLAGAGEGKHGGQCCSGHLNILYYREGEKSMLETLRVDSIRRTRFPPRPKDRGIQHVNFL